MTSASAVVADESFGPQWLSYFDFTLTFENWFFTVLPGAFLIALSPFYFFFYLKHANFFRYDACFWIKLLASSAMFIVNLTLSALWSQSSDYPKSAIVAVVLGCVADLCVVVVMVLTHLRALHSSTALSVYLTAACLVSIAKSRSFFMRGDQFGLKAVGVLATVDAVLKALLVVAEEMPKSPLEENKDFKNASGEANGGFWTRTLLIWLLPTLRLGYSRSLSVSDLKSLGPNFSSKRLVERFQPLWERADKNKPHCLLRATLLTFALECLMPIVSRLTWSAFNFTIPWLMRRLLGYIRDKQSGTAEEGGGLIGAAALVYFGLMATNTCTRHLTIIAQVKIRGALVAVVLKKNLRLSLSTVKESAALTLMSTDVDGIVGSTSQIYDVVAAPIEVGVAFYLLWREVDAAFFLPVVSVILASIIIMLASSHFLAIKMTTANAAWNKTVETRVAAMSNVLDHLKAIKINGYEKVVAKHLQTLRKVEIKGSNAFRRVVVTMTALIPLQFALTPTLVVAGALFWTTWKNGLDPVTVFPTFVLVFLLSRPLYNILMCWPYLGGVVGVFGRLQKFLLLPERVDPRIFRSPDDLPGVPTEKAEIEQQATAISQDPEKSSFVSAKPVSNVAIALTGVSVALTARDKPILDNVDLIVKRSALTMIIGPVGCGKSFLLKALLGETALLKGSIVIDKTPIAFCHQSTWLPNSTIRKVIVGQGQYDEARYLRVTSACMLNFDFQRLSKGDQTNIGSNGALLSGGQKQRLALARALYLGARLVFLDDVFSALDRKTARSVFAKLFEAGGILGPESGTTTVLATHSIEFLDKADNVVVFNADKTLVKQATDATISQLRERGLLAESAGEAGDTDEDEADFAQAAALAAAETDDTEKEESKESYGADFSLYRYFLKPAPKVLLSIFFILVASAAFVECSIPAFMRAWTEVAPTNKYWFIGLALLGIGAIVINGATAGLFQLVIMPVLSLSFHDQFLATLLNAKVTFLTAVNIGALLNRGSQDMTLVSETLPKTFFLLCFSTFLAIGSTGLILSAVTYSIAIIPFMLFLVYLLQTFYIRTSRQMRVLDLESKTPLYSKLAETISGLDHIRAFGWEAATLEESLRLLDYSQKPVFYMQTIQRWLSLVLDISTTIVATAIVSFASFWTQTATQSSIGLGLLGLMDWNENFANWVSCYIQFETSLGAAQRLRTFIAETPVEVDKSSKGVPNWPSNGHIVFDNVTARYDPNSDYKVLDGVSMVALPGQKIGITGRTGSGKSSFVLTLLKMIDYTGQVTIDGVDILDIPRHQLRRAMTKISQDSIDLAGTVRDNMLPQEADIDEAQLKEHDGEMRSILIRVELWDKISDEGGLDATLQDLGLSHGQKQLFSLARAMMHKSVTGSKIILIDEATSNIDRESDVRLQAVMKEAFAGCTRLIIAHRLENIEESDKVLEFSEGKLVNKVTADKQQAEQ